ncbi:hypothetical protein [Mesorhizobium sp. WSM3879]|uniref:hypothetical protein n=2 Tax=unclassified Mesorhizobium TaxID=325217 RepID=UPI00117C3354|nr:hypothetical protein [Mesorhizobium sp. WSM3879]
MKAKTSSPPVPAPQISTSPCNSKNDPRTPRQRMKLKRSREAEGRIVIGQLGIRPETVSVLYETGRLPNRFPTRQELYDAVQQHLDSLILGSIDK